jgi:hypothetical protein
LVRGRLFTNVSRSQAYAHPAPWLQHRRHLRQLWALDRWFRLDHHSLKNFLACFTFRMFRAINATNRSGSACPQRVSPAFPFPPGTAIHTQHNGRSRSIFVGGNSTGQGRPAAYILVIINHYWNPHQSGRKGANIRSPRTERRIPRRSRLALADCKLSEPEKPTRTQESRKPTRLLEWAFAEVYARHQREREWI